MKFALIALLLAVVWAAITGAFTALNLAFGLGIALLALFILREAVGQPKAWRRLRLALALAGLFGRELVLSAWRVAITVITPDLGRRLRPAIVAVPLTVTSDAEIALLANLITLTPGTLSVDVSDDRHLLYVHVLTLDTREDLIAGIVTGFEARVREVFA